MSFFLMCCGVYSLFIIDVIYDKRTPSYPCSLNTTEPWGVVMQQLAVVMIVVILLPCSARSTKMTSVVSTLLPGAGSVIDITFDRSGNIIYLAYASNSVRRVLTSGYSSTLVAGSGAIDFADGVGVAAVFWYP